MEKKFYQLLLPPYRKIQADKALHPEIPIPKLPLNNISTKLIPLITQHFTPPPTSLQWTPIQLTHTQKQQHYLHNPREVLYPLQLFQSPNIHKIPFRRFLSPTAPLYSSTRTTRTETPSCDLITSLIIKKLSHLSSPKSN